MDILAEIEAKKNEKYKTTEVEKNLELELDLKNLLANDSNELDAQALKGKDREEWLKKLARDNTQLLLNAIWELSTERIENDVVASLPPATTRIPRAKRCPKPKPLTKWESFALEKGIKNKKKTNVVWDDLLQKWVPRFGYRRADAEKQKDWVLEVPQNADPMEDQFAKKAEAKKEKVAKNEFQRLRNIAAAKKIKVPKEGLPPVETPSSQQLSDAATVARASTASLGRFQRKLPKEQSNESFKEKTNNRKRKINHSLVSADSERTSQLAIADGLLNKRPALDIEKAVNQHIHEEERERSRDKANQPGKSKKGGRKRQASMARNKKGGATAGKRIAGGKKGKAGGRKRR